MMKNSSNSKPSPLSPHRKPIGAPVYQSSLMGLQEQALLHRICAEVMSSSSANRCIFVAPNTRGRSLHVATSKSWVRPEQVLEILDGALYIAVDEDPLAYAAEKAKVPLSYASSTTSTTSQKG